MFAIIPPNLPSLPPILDVLFSYNKYAHLPHIPVPPILHKMRRSTSICSQLCTQKRRLRNDVLPISQNYVHLRLPQNHASVNETSTETPVVDDAATKFAVSA